MSSSKPEIGVVIPAHPNRIDNGMLDRAVQSVFKQTYKPSQLCVYIDKTHRGAPYARQRALEMNQCEWTAFLDSDDWFMPHHLETLITAAQEHGADYVYTWYELVQFNQSLKTHDPVFPPGHFEKPWDDNEPRQTTMTVLVRTGIAKQIGFWEPADEQNFADGHRVGEDYLFTLGCLKAGARFYHVVERTWFWHHHGLNTSGRPDRGDAR